jgi:hypothetical protein
MFSLPVPAIVAAFLGHDVGDTMPLKVGTARLREKDTTRKDEEKQNGGVRHRR